MNHNDIAAAIGVFIGLLCAALLLSLLAERLAIPSAVLLVSAGLVAGSVWHVRMPLDFSSALLFLFLPPLIFEAAWNVHLDDLRRSWKPVTALALPGTLLVACAIAAAILALHALPFDAALLLGSIIAATDPIAVIAVFRRFDVPRRVRTIVEAESISNDGIAVVLYTSALAAAMGDTPNLLGAAGRGALSVFGGVAVGCALAYGTRWVVRMTAAAEYEVTATMALAYLSYFIADRAGLSGIFACASAAVALRGLQLRRAFMTHVQDADRFWNTTAYIVNAIVFIETGLAITFDRIVNEPLLIAVVIAAVFFSRAAVVAVVFRNAREGTTAFLAGMRGALPLALALALPQALPHRAQIIDAVFATIFATLVVQGLALAPMIGRLYPAALGDAPRDR